MDAAANRQQLKRLLLDSDPSFWTQLAEQTQAAESFDELLFLSSLRKKALSRGLEQAHSTANSLRLAVIGGYSLYPMTEILEHCLFAAGIRIELFSGDFDNYTAEVADPASSLYAFEPEVLCILPSPRLTTPSSTARDTREDVEAEARNVTKHLLEICATAHERSSCEIVLANFPLPARYDIGSLRARIPASPWSFTKLLNLELGFNAPQYVHICDLEFITNRFGGISTGDDRAWFESKQPGSPILLTALARELAAATAKLRIASKKVLVLDLDNTLWGGVIGDDGLEGIEIGDTSARGEAFKSFQHYIKSLKDRGVLLAVCSKNDHEKAIEPFEKHPEMVLRMSDFSAFTANWEPKADNIRAMAAELNLGLDSFVFVDDNAAEIDIVRQFAPEVVAIHLGPDPAAYRAILQDSRQFEPLSITAEDAKRTEQYISERERKSLLASAVDMDAYLTSLGMVGTINPFAAVDVPRLSQLINKSNQFNLTTRRRTEAEVSALVDDPERVAFSVRLSDRFGDHGLIAIAIGRVDGRALEIDTWLMSCRVLKRQVEEEVLNEFARAARDRGCSVLRGKYIPTKKNGMVSRLYPDLGFVEVNESAVENGEREYILDIESFQPRETHIEVNRNTP